MREENKKIQDFEENITVENVQFYCKHSKLLKNTQNRKALQFVDYDCIRYVGDDVEFNSKYTFVCLPLNTDEKFFDKESSTYFYKKPYPVFYNNSIYKIFKKGEGFECNCQGWQTRARRGEFQEDGCMCSHVLALFYMFKLKRFNR